VLIQLARATDNALRMSDLADAIVLSRSGLTRLVDRLVAEGYVERRRCPSDARGALATLTPAGFERVRDAAGTHLQSVRRLFLDRFSGPELEALGSYWERLDARVEARACEPGTTVRDAS
jgi:DNA-binding MarR family transcriptional regulator